MISNRERERQTLDFKKPEDRGAVEETFYPWLLTAKRFKADGMPIDIADSAKNVTSNIGVDKNEKYLPVSWGASVMKYEQYLGFDAVRRISFVLPFRRFAEKVLETTKQYTIRQNLYGEKVIQYQGSELELEHAPVIETMTDWQRLKEHADRELELYYSDEALEEAYGHLRKGHDEGEYSIRLNVEGFFWVPRGLMGIEPHLYAFYDEPELMHDINEYVLEIYRTKLMKVIEMVQPDVVYIMEDLSGKTGPMISQDCFDEFVGDYYKQIIPLMKAKGVGNVFVDTDGEFTKLIPSFMAAGVDGFLPMDVNAGMDIVAVRAQFPTLKFIGGFNKLEIAKGREAIDKEFARILPVIRGGGYIPGSDHQVAPSTSLADYEYYISKLKEIMKQAGADAKK